MLITQKYVLFSMNDYAIYLSRKVHLTLKKFHSQTLSFHNTVLYNTEWRAETLVELRR